MAACGERRRAGQRRQAHCWGRTKAIGFHGGRSDRTPPVSRARWGRAASAELGERGQPDLLGKWAMNQMLINVSRRRFKRSVRSPEGDVPASDGAGPSKSATCDASRRCRRRGPGRGWVLGPTILIFWRLQIDGIDMDEDMLLVAAIGVDANGDKHPLGLVEGPTETQRRCRRSSTTSSARTRSNRATPVHHRWRKAPSRRSAAPLDAMRRSSVASFTRRAAFWSGRPNRCTLRCGASVLQPGNGRCRRAETLLRNLARRLEPDWIGVSASTWKGSTRCSPLTGSAPCELCRSPACTNIIENVMGTGAEFAATSNTALALDGPAMAPPPCTKRSRLPSIEGKKASASPSRRSWKARSTAAFQISACPNRRGGLKFQCATTASRISTDTGHPRTAGCPDMRQSPVGEPAATVAKRCYAATAYSAKRFCLVRHCRQRYKRNLRRIRASRFVSTCGVWQKPK